MQANQLDVSFSEKWIKHQRRLNRTITCWACVYCSECPEFSTEEALWEHLTTIHRDRVVTEAWKLWYFKKQFFRDCREKKFPKKPLQPPTSSGQAKRPMINFHPPVRIWASVSNDDISMRDAIEDDYIDQPRKRPAIGSGTSQGLVSPRKGVSRYDLPRGPEARLASVKYGDTGGLDPERARAKNRLLNKGRAPPSRLCSLNLSNTSSSKASEARVFQEQPKDGKAFHYSCNDEKSQNSSIAIVKDESYNIMLRPETRPISQEQLVAEVKGIYAGLVMVEATCIEVDNKQATFATRDSLQKQPEPNLKQWQALIALHGSLLHENHDFFLASQHPSSSPALRRLAPKNAMPARVWRHGIHSFLELLRQRMPISLHHMLAFIHLAYSIISLLYETVPAFEDTWIGCLGDLGRYRMAIEDDDIRDREAWVEVAKYTYLKASVYEPAIKRSEGCFAHAPISGVLQPELYSSKSMNRRVHFDSRDQRRLAHTNNMEQHNGRQSIFESKASKNNLVPDNSGRYQITKQQPLPSSLTGRFMIWFLKQLSSHPFILISYVCVSQTVCVLALPPECITTPTEESIFETFMLAGTLLGLFIGILYSRERLGDDAVAITPVMVNIALIKLDNDDRFSTGQLAATEVFSLALNVALLKPRLDRLKRTGALTWFLIAFLGCGSTFALDYLHPPTSGRLADPFIAFAIRGLPITLGWSFLWIAFIEQLGLAERIDRGDFDAHVGAFLQWFIDILRHIVHITVDLFIPRLLEVWMNRFLGLNNIREQQPFDMEAGTDVRFPRHDPFPDFLGANVPIPRPRDEFPDAWGEDPGEF